MATRVWESTVIDAPTAIVWELVRPLNFSYNGSVLNTVTEGKVAPNEVGSVRAVTYKDKTVQKLRLTELSDSKHTVSWDLVDSVPAHHVMSASYSVRLRPITQGNLTFVEWIVDFSKDVSNEVIIDAGFKAKEQFKALAACAKSKVLERGAAAKLGKAQVSVPELKRQLSTKSAQLHKLFAELDTNHNGHLEFDEFAMAVNKLYGENLPDEGIRMLIAMADTNSDNVVSYEEFVKFLAAEGLEGKAQSIADHKQPALTIHYFNARGRAETARLVCAEAGLKYTDKRHEFADFQANLKGKCPFGQMPALEVDGKTTIAQSAAINRYLAKLGGLYGKNNEEAAKVDMVCELFWSDLSPAFGAAYFEKDAKLKEEKMTKFLQETAPAALSNLEKLLASAPKGSKYVLGNQVSLADLTIFNDCSRILNLKPEALNATPLLAQLVTRVGARPAVSAWLKARPATQN